MIEIKGVVAKGDKYGRTIGFPTANILTNESLEPGIYAGFADILGKKYGAALYKSERRKNILEAHILNFEGDLYGKEIEVEILKKIRDDEMFESENLMKEKIENDIKEIKNFLLNLN